MRSTFRVTLTLFIVFLAAVVAFGILHTRADEKKNDSGEASPSSSASESASESAAPSGSAADSGSGAAAVAEDQLVNVQGVNYIVSGGEAASLFVYNKSAADQYANALNRFKASIDASVRVYSLLVPTAGEFSDSELAKNNSDSQKEAFAHIGELLDPGIVQVDAYDALASHLDDYVYYRTDHHWTALGAYYAYKVFAEATGEQPASLDDFKEGTIGDFLGSEYKTLQLEELKANPDTIVYYTPTSDYEYTAYSTKNAPLNRDLVNAKYANDTNGLYAVFMGGDTPWGEITTESASGRTLLVVKDSYANAFIPYLLDHYSKIYYVDPRSYTGNLTDFATEKQATDVLFLNNATVARITGIAELIDSLL
ncbi:DHHW family protein [Cohnella fermenti]|nr:DHHW family protein [Cohnella fermenti]